MATLADAAGVSPRVVQKLMRHSTLELTGKYTRPRAVDIEAGTSKLPNLKPDSYTTESMAATGTAGATHRNTFAPSLRPDVDGAVRFHAALGDLGHVESQVAGLVDKIANPCISRGLPPALISTGDGTRTHDLRIMRRQPDIRNASSDRDLCQEIRAVPHHFPTDMSQMDTGLSAVIQAWARIPDAVRAGIVAIVKAARA
jgi:acetyl esterase/lipase